MKRNTPETMSEEHTRSFTDDDVQYWIYEFRMTEAKRKKLEEAAANKGITPEECLIAILNCALDDAEKTNAARKDTHECGVRLVRYYPVLKGETEAEALERTKAQEAQGDIANEETDCWRPGEYQNE